MKAKPRSLPGENSNDSCMELPMHDRLSFYSRERRQHETALVQDLQADHRLVGLGQVGMHEVWSRAVVARLTLFR
jgi:hypothetical protein